MELTRAFSKDEVWMAKKHSFKNSIPLAIRKMQIKTTVRFHLTPVGMAKINKTKEKTKNAVWLWERGGTYLLMVWVQNGADVWKTVWKFLKELEIDRSHDRDIPFLDIHPKDSISYYTDICSSTFIADLFTRVKKWKQSRYAPITE